MILHSGTSRKYLASLLLLTGLVLIPGFLVTSYPGLNLRFSDIVILTFSFALISLLSVFIFLRGVKREPASRTIHLLAALSTKFIVEMFLALAWFFIAKKSGTSSLISFFVLYLAFSIMSIFFMLNTLKKKSL